MFRQSKWDEPLIFEIARKGERRGALIDHEFEDEFREYSSMIPKDLIRDSIPGIPNLSEVDVIRHYTRLSQMSYGVDVGPVPLGSCTMKYNPRICEELTMRDDIMFLHPYQDEDTLQGILEIMYIMQNWLAEITGMDACSLQPPAGAAGEFVGVLIIKKYHQDKGMAWKDEIIVPDSAHGTNPASAAMAGYKVISIPSDREGNVDFDALISAINDRTAGMMLTNPNTLGIFESRITEIADAIHRVDGLLYYDGANLNGILGIVRPGDMGFDIVHLNLHKTFSTPHGGGGPGAGAVCVKSTLKDYLPVPIVEKVRGKYRLKYDIPKTIGRISWFYGNVIPVIKAFIYLSMLGPAIKEVAEVSVLNTNYFLKKVENLRGVELTHGKGRWRKHELVISLEKLAKETGVNAEDVAKALLDRGIHAPTIYFPLIVPEAHMIELTESETIENIDSIIEAYRDIINDAYSDPEKVKKTPVSTAKSRLDPLIANHPRSYAPTYKYIERIRSRRRSST